jgi:hypothetical protein
MDPQSVHTEEFRVNGEAVIGKVKELVNEGNVRRVILKTEEGRTLVEIPLTMGAAVGVAAVILFPVWAAIGAIAALATRLTIVVERVDKPSE